MNQTPPPSPPGFAWMPTPAMRLLERIVRQRVLMQLLSVMTALAVLIYGVADFPIVTHVALSLMAIAAALFATFVRPEFRLISVVLSVALSFRYIIWRGIETLNLDAGLSHAAVSILLYGAEIYTVFVLVAGYFQTTVFFERRPVDLPLDRSLLPSVDVFVPTYSEPVDIVRRTLVSAMAMDYPNKRVYLLDDGRRQEMRDLAEEVGCSYLDRPDNRHAKAGNINAALPRTEGAFIAFFDADHAPVRSFLTVTMGFFLQNPRLALVQTPHHFYNSDPFERNLYQAGVMPPEQNLFYHLVQVSNDFWNSAFFCGSCAVIRREALEEIGGVAVETVTEDAHTSLKMHARGWDSAYLNLPQAAGLATESFGAYVGQRIRWARGMAQILRVDPPFLKAGLTISQRINYTAAATHFLFGLPRLVFLVAPVFYLVFDLNPLRVDVSLVLLYAVPHLLLAYINASAAHGNQRHTFWPEVYETAIAPYTALVTTVALFAPSVGSFNVTPKGHQIDKTTFDWRIARVTMVLLVLVMCGTIMGTWKMFTRPEDTFTLGVVLFWNFFNLVLLLASLAVAVERPQRRAVYRIPSEHHVVLHETAALPVDVVDDDIDVEDLDESSYAPLDDVDAGPLATDASVSQSVEAPVAVPSLEIKSTLLPDTNEVPTGAWGAQGHTVDLSELGGRFILDHEGTLPQFVRVTITGDEGEQVSVAAEILGAFAGAPGKTVVRARFLQVDSVVRHGLIRLMFGRPNTWAGSTYDADRPVMALLTVLGTPFRAAAIHLGLLATPPEDGGERSGRERVHTPVLQCHSCSHVLIRATECCPHCGASLDHLAQQSDPAQPLISVGAVSGSRRALADTALTGVALPLILIAVAVLTLTLWPMWIEQAPAPATAEETLVLVERLAREDAVGLAEGLEAHIRRDAALPRDWGFSIRRLRDEYPAPEEGRPLSHDTTFGRALGTRLQQLHMLDRQWRMGAPEDVVSTEISALRREIAALPLRDVGAVP
ncbi:MAG: glycosyltransferase [Myxococcota bacterium]